MVMVLTDVLLWMDVQHQTRTILVVLRRPLCTDPAFGLLGAVCSDIDILHVSA